MKTQIVGPWLWAGLLALAALPLDAQTRSPTHVAGPTLRVGLARPFLTGDDDWGLSTAVLTARISVPVDSTLALFAEAALAHASLRSASSTTLSNVRLGLVVGREGRTHGGVGVTLPTHREWGEDDFASAIGFVTEAERLEAFFGRAFAADVWVTPMRVNRATGATFGANFGLRMVSSVDDSMDEAELYSRYGAFVGGRAGALRIGAELVGLAFLSEEDLDLGERTVHSLDLSAALSSVRGNPTLNVRIPLDADYRNWLRTVVAFSIDIG